MRMTRHDRALKYYPVTRAPDGEGIMVATLGTAVDFMGDLQPLSRTASRRAEFGLDSTEAKAKVCFYDTGLNFLEGGVIEDGSTRYMISGPPNPWEGHNEAIMVAWNGS